jgi:hypothetical protein
MQCLSRVALWVSVGLVVASVAAQHASALDPPGAQQSVAARTTGVVGFRTPSNNIHCQVFSEDKTAFLRCDVMAMSNRPPPKPHDCEFDWGQAFTLTLAATPGRRICYSDTVVDERLPVLPYGSAFSMRGFVCRSEQSGVSCVNPNGHGLTLARASQNTF